MGVGIQFPFPNYKYMYFTDKTYNPWNVAFLIGDVDLRGTTELCFLDVTLEEHRRGVEQTTTIRQVFLSAENAIKRI